MKRKILLYGTGTYKNRGVEAIVNSTINQIDLKQNDLTIATYDLEYNKHFYSDKVKYINQNRKNNLTEEEKALEEKYRGMPFDYNNYELLYQKDVVDQMEKSDICISIGGDSYCYPPCNWLYALDKKSHDLGKKTVLWGASLFEKITDHDLINNLNNFDVLVIRESLTLEAIKDYVDQDKIIFERDPAFSLKMKEVELNEWYNNRKYMIINLSPLTIKNENQYQAIIEFIKYILKETKYSICLLPHVTTEDCSDMEILSRINHDFLEEERVYLEEGNYDCEELKYIISKSSFAIVARTHASIAGYSTAVPTLVIGYSVKSKGIAKDLFGDYQNYVINKDELTSTNLIEKYQYIEKNREKIIEKLKKEMINIKIDTSHIFEKVIEKLEEQEKKAICKSTECINCNLCKKVCPQDAIKQVETELHFTYNQRDTNKCINCGKCLKICPILNPEKKENFQSVSYAAKNKDINIQKESTSGGVFTAIAEEILKEKGVVYGAQRIHGKTSHIRVNNKKDLQKIRGSKYSYSKLDDILGLIEKDCKSNKKILFSGTPCQVGAMKKLIGKYKNIVYVSVICHGVLNDALVDEYCKKENVELLQYRTKERGWQQSHVKYDKYTNEFNNDKLLSLYISNVILRESCYECKYKENNPADLILGDYWGIKEEAEEMFDNNGVSVVIVNSKKGQEMFQKIKNKLLYKQTEIDHLKITHPNLYQSPKKPIDRYNVEKRIKESSWQTAYELDQRRRKIDDLNREITNLKLELVEREHELDSMKNSKRWKIINNIAKIIRK